MSSKQNSILFYEKVLKKTLIDSSNKNVYIHICYPDDEKLIPTEKTHNTGFVDIRNYEIIWNTIEDFVFVPGFRVCGRKTAILIFLKKVTRFNKQMQENVKKSFIDKKYKENTNIVIKYEPIFKPEKKDNRIVFFFEKQFKTIEELFFEELRITDRK